MSSIIGIRVYYSVKIEPLFFLCFLKMRRRRNVKNDDRIDIEQGISGMSLETSLPLGN